MRQGFKTASDEGRQQMPYRSDEHTVEPETTSGVPVNPMLEKMRRGLKRRTTEFRPSSWLDTGNEYLNSVLGSREYGLPFSRMYEISGPESHGKSALVMELAGMAQRNNDSAVIWYDAESTFDGQWAENRGIDIARPDFFLIQPYEMVEMVKKQEVTRPANSDDLFVEMEGLVTMLHATNPEKTIFIAVDSIASLMPKDEAETGTADYNMRTMMSLPMFLTRTLKRWVTISRTCNVMLILINQLREKPGVMYGDPSYTPGGKALKFYCSVRANMARVRGGDIKQGKLHIGAKGIIKNMKNKAGRQSQEKLTCGFKLFFDGKPSKFVEDKDIKRED